MDLAKIHYFLTAAELQNFTKAAESCHIAQTTMSKYIAALEQEIGCRLFVRTRKKAVLTSQGEEFYRGMKRIAEQYHDLCSAVHRDKNKELRIGMVARDYIELPILHSFEQEFQDISLYFTFAEEEKLFEDLKRQRLDALICPDILKFCFEGEERLKRTDLWKIEESLVCSKELLEEYQTIGEVIKNRPFITKTDDGGYHQLCRQKLAAMYGASFGQVQVVGSLTQQLLLLNLSKGFVIIPTSMGTELEKTVRFPLDESFQETAQLIYDSGNSSGSLFCLLDYIHEKKC